VGASPFFSTLSLWLLINRSYFSLLLFSFFSFWICLQQKFSIKICLIILQTSRFIYDSKTRYRHGNYTNTASRCVEKKERCCCHGPKGALAAPRYGETSGSVMKGKRRWRDEEDGSSPSYLRK
jgi:hypothetical protein